MGIKQIATDAFIKEFTFPPTHYFHAPGRVNIIGEHTDYNEGFVLPAAINFGTGVAASKRTDSLVRVCAANFNNEVVEFNLNDTISPSVESPCANYVRGVCLTLQKQGFAVPGLNLAIAGDVPYGAGLSSSAALEVVLIRAITGISGESIDPTQAALLGQKTENDFIGAHTGIMDQLISARGQQDHALLIDCRDLSTHAVFLDPSFKIVIFNSNVKRGLVDSEYNKRRQQCQQAADTLQITALRDATLDLLVKNKERLHEVVYRRARHIITENERTQRAAAALENKDWVLVGDLMAQSHQSMKHDFEITVPAIDGLVDLIQSILPSGSGGVRMTGGGFGGCVVALIKDELVKMVVDHVAQHYEASFGLKESVYICQAVNGSFMAQ